MQYASGAGNGMSMRYWVYADKEVRGPFEKEKLAALPGFCAASQVCPEGSPDGQNGWKAASAFPEVMAALETPAAPPRPAAAPSESPLALTMRGSLIAEPPEEPAARPVPAAAAEESPLALTMRGSLIPEPVKKPSPSPVSQAPAPVSPAPRPAAVPGGDGAALAAIAEAQQRMAARLDSIERSVAELKSLLFPGLQKQ